MIIMVAVTDMNWGIGNARGELLFDLPKDLKHFKSTTSGKHVVMGRKTWESLPVKPLPKRKNYVLSNDRDYAITGRTKVLHSIDEVLELSKDKDVYIIGGGEIYKQFMPIADKLIITHVHAIEISARTFFPEIDIREWKLVNAQKNEEDKKHKHSFTFATYERSLSREQLAKQEQEKQQTQEEKVDISEE